jgi:type II secretory pathway component PulM
VAVAAVCLLLVAGTYCTVWSPADAHGETERRFFDIWRRRSSASRIS